MAAIYDTFLASKQFVAPAAGITVDPSQLHPSAFQFQRDVTAWALRKGRAANFAATGMGKTLMQLDWANHIPGRTLILAPLGVTLQTERESQRWSTAARNWGLSTAYCRTDENARITITNYEMLAHFNPSAFDAVVLDESSILKAFDGKTRTALIKAFADMPYRLCCTATPAPNDIAEIANHAEFLGLMTRAEMLATFFIHDDNGWRLKGHAREPFFRWMASWAFCLTAPSDLGYSDDGFVLPPLRVNLELVDSGYTPDGQLFPTGLRGITDRAKVRKKTVDTRVARAAKLVDDAPNEQWLVWCGLNEEGRALARMLPEAILVEGSDDPELKASMLEGFATGHHRILITKPTIAGFGMNFQRCARMLFLGLNDSWEQYFQAIRRCWRFGQQREVLVSVVISDAEAQIYENVLRKDAEAQAMTRELVKHLAAFERAELGLVARDRYEPSTEMALPIWVTA